MPQKPSRQTDAYRDPHGRGFIGDELTEGDLDSLWCVIAGHDDPNPDTSMRDWWDDKANQLAYRLILRLTRAEMEKTNAPEA